MSDLVMVTGTDGVYAFGPVYRGGDPAQPVDLTLAGTKLWFTIKATPGDADAAAKFQVIYTAGGATTGLTVVGTGAKNTGQIVVPDSTAAILALTETTIWSWSLLLEEPNTQREQIDWGAFKIRVGVGRPA